ncbi:hypothetical protein [Nostoc sp.]
MGHRAWRIRETRQTRRITNAQYPMPNTQCPMPNAQCPIPNS